MAEKKEVSIAPIEGEVVGNIRVFDAEEYAEYSIANGRTRYGGVKGVKVNATVEELRALINSNWKPSMVMEKWQMDDEELQQLVWALSQKELRDKPIKLDIKNDFFR